jgi:hypothetical protein
MKDDFLSCIGLSVTSFFAKRKPRPDPFLLVLFKWHKAFSARYVAIRQNKPPQLTPPYLAYAGIIFPFVTANVSIPIIVIIQSCEQPFSGTWNIS